MDYIIALIIKLFIKMTQSKIIVKVRKSEVEMLKTISDLAKSMVAKKGKTLLWLRFAKKNSTGGFSFVPHKETQWSVLEKIAEKASILYPKKRSGEIVDLISELVNATGNDCLSSTWTVDLIKLSPDEKKYLRQTLISLVGSETYVPRHAYLYPVKKIDQNNWKVKDLKTGKIMQVIKTKQRGNYFFFIQPTDRKTV